MAFSPMTTPTPDSQPPPAPSISSFQKSQKSSPPTSLSPLEKTPSSPPPTTTPASPPLEKFAASPSSSSSPSPPPSSSDGSPSIPSLAPSPPPPPSPPSSSALSPPPPHSTRTHTPPSPSRSAMTQTTTDVNLPLVIGFTTTVGILLVIMILIFCCCTKRKKKLHNSMHHYQSAPGGGPYPPKGGDYYNNGQHPNWKQPMEHVVKIPPAAAGGMWGPPPHPMAMNNSEFSSNYSGPRPTTLPPPSPNIALGFNKGSFTCEELSIATGGFSESNLLGQGGFGYVHKGVLPNGKEVAVKQLKSGSGQGEREFQAEVDIISRVHHRHLVSLVGYSIADHKRMLVYEFVPNNTLEYHLHGEGLPTMDWPTRLKIALGSAKGLAYLHEDCHPRIIHRDIKAANILLDLNFEAMVADFGLAKLSSDTNTHVSTRVMGTFGYLAPEYAASGKLTEKSDVFSFGVMLLELITGRRPVDTCHSDMDDSLVEWARPLLTHALVTKNYNELVDPRLENNYNPNEMARLVASAAASVRHSARKRPKMSQIVRALEGDVSLEDLNGGMRPGESTVFGSNGSTDYDSSSHNGHMKGLRSTTVGSREFESGELNGTIDEYGLNPSDSSTDNGNSGEIKSVGRRTP